jgi:hypothetical protein
MNEIVEVVYQNIQQDILETFVDRRDHRHCCRVFFPFSAG